MLRAANAMGNPDRDTLLRETHRLNQELGYIGFRHQYFNDADAIKEWAEPAMRERELRSFWDKQWEGSYASYQKDFARYSFNVLAAYYDHLRDLVAGDKDDQIAYYHRLSEMGRGVRLTENGFSQSNAADDRPATPSEIVRVGSRHVLESRPEPAREHDNGRER
jgi:hypothetical protein